MPLPYDFGDATQVGQQFFTQLQADLEALFAGTVSTLPQGRLSLTSGVAVTSSDVVGATTDYYVPAVGRYVPIWNGTQFVNVDIGGELSQATTDTTKSPAAVANNSVYDKLVWLAAGTPSSSRGPAWSSDTSRGTGAGTTEVEQINGIWVNKFAITNGPVARFGTLVGSVRSNGSAQLMDSAAFRWVSNIYNAVSRNMLAIEPANSWTYTTAAFRQANANAANQLDFLQSLAGGLLTARVRGAYANTNTTEFGIVGIDIDTLNTSSIINNRTAVPTIGLANQVVAPSADYSGYPGLGRHIAIWKEYSSAGGTGTFLGDGGGTVIQTGISGEILN